MRRFWLNVVAFFHSLAWGLKSADDIVSKSNKESDGSDGEGIVQRKESHSVYDDLLRGEVTQEVKELRHEMYYAERKSHEYEYKGNGTVVKKNTIFDYEGNVENSDNRKILIVQENKEDPSTLFDFGIYSNVNTPNAIIDTEKMGDPSKKSSRNFTIAIDRDFIPSMRIEEYATKVVVKSGNDDEHFVLDIYVSQYVKQFDRRSRIFVNEIERIYMGDKRSDVIDFNRLGFVTSNAYGAPDLTIQAFEDIHFFNITKFDGNYVLSFYAKASETNNHDIVTEFYDEKAAEKNDKHEMREGASISLEAAIEAQNRENIDMEEAENLIKEFENGQK